MTTTSITLRMISDFCRKRIAAVLPPQETERLRRYLTDLHGEAVRPPHKDGTLDWSLVGEATDIDSGSLRSHAKVIRPIFEALDRRARKVANRPRRPLRSKAPSVLTPAKATWSWGDVNYEGSAVEEREVGRKMTGVPPRPIVEFPEPMWHDWTDPPTFAAALTLHMERHGDSVWHLHRAVVGKRDVTNRKTLQNWRNGAKAPRSSESMRLLGKIENRYRLPEGYFKAKLPHKARATSGPRIRTLSASEQRRLAWHLPDDFHNRPFEEQEEILGWVNSVVISGSTDYRRFQAAAMRQRYAVRFRNLDTAKRTRAHQVEDFDDFDLREEEVASGVVDAPPELEREMADLLRFKTSTLAAFGYQRNGVWGEETAAQKVEHLGLMFGALAARPSSAVRGYGVPITSLSFGMLIFPAVWDWYLQWRESRRGFYTAWEVDMARVAAALTRAETGWLRQSPQLADRLRAVSGLVSAADIAEARADWQRACDTMHKHALGRAKEIQRVARVHRDPFEPILPVLQAASPVGEYRKITEEILRLMPNERLYPRAAAEAVRSFLLLRLGLHLGLRQKNLRQLLVCPRGGVQRTERQLVELKRGELRWSERDAGWEVLIPSIAFKNATSSFFGSKPFRLILPNLGCLYEIIEAYISRHRAKLLAGATDPGTFFVKTAKRTSTNAEYDQNTFYEAWRLVIQRYGIKNPYTGRGAIEGLLPHGPHNVRDVLATHILKQTGSYEQASYAIQDTPDMVAQHYGRFLPQDKSALAAQILNRVWDVA